MAGHRRQRRVGVTSCSTVRSSGSPNWWRAKRILLAAHDAADPFVMPIGEEQAGRYRHGLQRCAKARICALWSPKARALSGGGQESVELAAGCQGLASMADGRPEVVRQQVDAIGGWLRERWSMTAHRWQMLWPIFTRTTGNCHRPGARAGTALVFGRHPDSWRSCIAARPRRGAVLGPHCRRE